MRTPDEIKKGLQYCMGTACGTIKMDCPYEGERSCHDIVLADALTYIQLLESTVQRQEKNNSLLEDAIEKFYAELSAVKAERAAAVADLKIAKRCNVCKHDYTKDAEEPCFSCSCCCGVNNFEWRGVQKEG